MSFADMMTLLFCLFMVLFAISSVNTSKFEALQKSLQDAFSGAVLSGGKAVMASGSSDGTQKAAPQPPLPSLRPLTAINDTSAQSAAEREAKARQEEQDFRALKRRVDNLAKDAGLQGKVKVTVRRRGLVIQLLTDKVFFDSGDATLKPAARQAGRQDRRRRARRAQAPGRRRRPHGLAADLRLSVPLQLGAVRRSRRRGRPRFRRQRRPGSPGLPLRFRLSGADCIE